MKVYSFSLYGNPVTHYEENAPGLKFHVIMSMYVLLNMIEIKSMEYHNLVMINHQ